MKKYVVIPTKQFRKDVSRLEKSGVDIRKLQTVIGLLENGKKLDARYKDHELKGKLKGVRECHIGPDWLLLYTRNDNELLLLLVATGTHRSTLGKE